MFVSAACAHVFEHQVSGVNDHADRIFPPFDFSFVGSHIFWFIGCFGIFYLFMAYTVLPRIGGIIDMRRKRIADDLDQAACFKAEADAISAFCEKKLDEARERANLIVRTASHEAKIKLETERAEANAVLENRLFASDRCIARIYGEAMQQVTGMSAEEVS